MRTDRVKLILKERIKQVATHPFWLNSGEAIPTTVLFNGRIYVYDFTGYSALASSEDLRIIHFKEIPHLHIDLNTPYAE